MQQFWLKKKNLYLAKCSYKFYATEQQKVLKHARVARNFFPPVVTCSSHLSSRSEGLALAGRKKRPCEPCRVQIFQSPVEKECRFCSLSYGLKIKGYGSQGYIFLAEKNPSLYPLLDIAEEAHLVLKASEIKSFSLYLLCFGKQYRDLTVQSDIYTEPGWTCKTLNYFC